METLVENLRKGYAQHIANVPWMIAETKKVALEKLAAFRPKIGYPDKWRNYSKLEVKPATPSAITSARRYLNGTGSCAV